MSCVGTFQGVKGRRCQANRGPTIRRHWRVTNPLKRGGLRSYPVTQEAQPEAAFRSCAMPDSRNAVAATRQRRRRRGIARVLRQNEGRRDRGGAEPARRRHEAGREMGARTTRNVFHGAAGRPYRPEPRLASRTPFKPSPKTIFWFQAVAPWRGSGRRREVPSPDCRRFERSRNRHNARRQMESADGGEFASSRSLTAGEQ
jgi:hypothetical protein